MADTRNPVEAKEREENAAWLIEYSTPFHCHLVKNEYAKFDYMLTYRKGAISEVYAVGEYRYRHCPKDQYPTLVMNCEKIHTLQKSGEHLNCKAMLFAQWQDTGVMYIQLPANAPGWAVTSGFERGEGAIKPHDLKKDVYHIPIEEFADL